MAKVKINRNRPKPEKQEIVRKQNFSNVLNAYKGIQQGTGLAGMFGKGKYLWIYPGAGLIMLVAIMTVFTQMQPDDALANSREPRPMIAEMDIPFVIFDMKNGQKGEVFVLDNGTRIIIPDDAFVNGKGKRYRKPVEVHYREFHDGMDIALSDISMEIDSVGKQGLLQTAGMFELYGYGKDGELLYLAEGKTIDVEMASYVNDVPYNIYFFDDEVGWEYRGLEEEIPAPKHELQADTALLPEPVAPALYDENAVVFDLKINPKKYPELKSIHKILWQYAGSDTSFLEENEWVFSRTWRNVVLDRQPNGTYRMKLSRGNNEFKALVKPVYAGESYEILLKEYELEMKNHKQAMELRRQEIERLSYQASIFRRLSLNQLGRWNCDIWLRDSEFVTVQAEFLLPEETAYPRIYHILGEGRSVRVYDSEKASDFQFLRTDKNILLAVTRDKKLIYLDSDSFRKSVAEKESVIQFDLTANSTSIRNLEELKQTVGLN